VDPTGTPPKNIEEDLVFFNLSENSKRKEKVNCKVVYNIFQATQYLRTNISNIYNKTPIAVMAPNQSQN
jgi:hypothetical protein